MKNIPHQFNRFDKLRGALQTAQGLGSRTGDDTTFGYEMARRRIYRFRSLTTPIEDRIAAEMTKSPGSQGARTAARDTRRLLVGLGLLDGAPGWALTPRGLELLAQPMNSAGEVAVWRRALVSLTVTDPAGHTSHPTCILLRMLRESGPLAKHVLALALEPADDSEPEYRRAVGLLNLDAPGRRAQLGISRYMDDDAVKILPSLTLQAGLTAQNGDQFRISPAGLAALMDGCGVSATSSQNPTTTVDPPRTDRRGRSGRSATQARHRMIRRFRDRPRPDKVGELDAATLNALSPEEQAAAALLRQERTRRHNDAVARLVRLNQGVGGCEQHEDPLSFDAVFEPDDTDLPVVLAEVKTLELDALVQVRLAIGQVLTYQHLDVEPNWPNRAVVRLAAFDAAIPAEYAAMLERFDIGAAVVDDHGFRPLNGTAERVAWMFVG